MKLKSLLTLFLFTLLLGVNLSSCGGGSSESSSSSQSEESSLSAVTGKWECKWNSDGALFSLTVEINSNGTGSVKLYGAQGFNDWTTIIDTRVSYTRIGDTLYWETPEGEDGNFVIEDNSLYTADGRAFSKKR